MSEVPSCFVAYSSTLPSHVETIEKAVENIQHSGVVDIKSWKSLAVGGRVIIGAISYEIRSRELFIADVTGLNPNVLFELGYAIAHNKRIWILLDPNIERAKLDFDRLQLLSTVGYWPYSNSNDIVKGFFHEQPYATLDKAVYKELLGTPPRFPKPTLLYLKSEVDTESSLRLARRVASARFSSVTDDPKEVRVQPLSWYVQQVTGAFAVVCHLLSTDYAGWQLHNAKHALIAGLAHGLSRPLLMLAHEPYSSPLDYRDILRTHNTAARAEALLDEWLLPLVDAYEKRAADQQEYQAEALAQGALQSIAIGDPVAEYESDRLADYFISTSAYNEALRSKHSIFVGRKGSGKSASLYKLADELSSDPRNHVCTIKPVGYELEGILQMLSLSLPRAEKGYLVESFWKFLLYTELAKSLYEQILSKPPFYTRTDAETELCEFVEEQRSLITPEFSVRLETVVNRLQQLPNFESAEAQRNRISERLHNDMLPRLRSLLGKSLKSKNKVAILVDNLDKAWDQRQDIAELSELLFGLLSVSGRIAQEFEKEGPWRASVNVSLTLFLRSDIHAATVRFAKERDKLPIRRMTWEDPLLLRRVVEERFMKSGADVVRPEQIWERYFALTVRNRPLREYLTESVLPRPRDMIYLVKTAMDFGVNRGHSRIEEEDILAAEQQYSRFAIDSLLVENGIRIPQLEELIYEFTGSNDVVTNSEVLKAAERAGVPEQYFTDVVDALCELTFLGLEIAPNRFAYLYNEDSRTKLQVMARKTAEDHMNGNPRYRINKPFHAYLELTSGLSNQMQLEPLSE